MRLAQRFLDRLTCQLPRDFIDVIERSRLDVDRGQVAGLAHAVEWTKAEPQRFPRDFSRRGVLAMGMMIPAAATLFWPRPVYAAGYTAVYPSIPIVTGPTYFVSDFVTSPTTPGTTTTQLQSALNAVVATGGTLVFSAGVTYHINNVLSLIGGSSSATAFQNFRIDGKGATLFRASGSNIMMQLRRCKKFLIHDLTLNGNGNALGGTAANLVFFEANSNNIGGGSAAIIRVISNHALGGDGSDCFLIRGDSGATGPTVNTHSRNMIFVDCEAEGAGRNGLTINNGHNIVMLGFRGRNFTKFSPQSAVDLEPNGQAADGDSVSQYLCRGGHFSGCEGKGIHISGGCAGTQGCGPIRFVTVEGSYFTDGLITPADPNGQGSAINWHCFDGLGRLNLCEDWTRTNQGGIFLMSGSNQCSGVILEENHFNDILTGSKAVLVALSGAGPGNIIRNNRAFNHSGALQAGTGASFSGNLGDPTITSPTFPSPMAPVDSFVGQACVP